MKLVVIGIPIYEKYLNKYEAISLQQAYKIFNTNYTIVFIAPKSLKFKYGDMYNNFGIERFSDEYFKNTETYSHMLLSKEFYQRFIGYKYILIYQLDAFVFSDKLVKFCHMNFDYIGAPIPAFMVNHKELGTCIGNGGLSLRNIRSAIRVTENKNKILKNKCFKYKCYKNEDLFFSFCGKQTDLLFRVPARRIAMSFSIEHEIDNCFKNISSSNLPFGCHAWYKINVAVWKPIISLFGYNLKDLNVKLEKTTHYFHLKTIQNELAERIIRYKKTRNLLKIFSNIIDIKGEYRIWGYGKDGKRCVYFLKLLHIKITKIYDVNFKQNIINKGYMYAVPNKKNIINDKGILIVATKNYENEIIAKLNKIGLIKGKNYLSFDELEAKIVKKYYLPIWKTMQGRIEEYSMKILFFGTGQSYQNNKKWFANNKKIEIVGFLDNDHAKQGNTLDGIKIFPPSIVEHMKFDIIYVMGKYVEEMREQLLQLGVNKDKIHDRFDLEIDCFSNHEYLNLKIYGSFAQISKLFTIANDSRRILLITYDFNLNGAGIVFLYLAQILHKLGCNITIAGMFDGPLKYKFLQMGIAVIVDNNFQITLLKYIKWINKFSLIWANTIWFYQLLKERNYNIPTIWWLHDSDMLYANININGLKKINFNNLFLYSVSDIADKAFKKYIPTAITNSLPYGIPDFYEKKETKHEDKLIFAIVGGICKRKAQDIFIEASKRLRHEYKNQVEFWIVGNYDNEFARDILEPVKKIDNIKILGELNREEIPNMYRNISVLVCPSYEDPLPVVTVEAMMNYKPCIVSTGVGTAKYIANDKAGFIIPTGDSDALYQKMKWFMEHRSAIKEMGINARNIYSKNFSMKEFENRVKKIMSDRLK